MDSYQKDLSFIDNITTILSIITMKYIEFLWIRKVYILLHLQNTILNNIQNQMKETSIHRYWPN